MHKTSINPKRLNWCLEYYRMGLEELAAKVKISPATLQRALDGKPAFSFKQLLKLAEKFGVDFLFFSDKKEINPQRMLTPQFREIYVNLPPDRHHEVARLVRRVEKHQAMHRRVLEEIELDMNWLDPRPFPSLGDRADFAGNGSKIRRWLGIRGSENFAELRQLVVEKNIMVFVSLSQGRWHVPKDEKGGQVQGFVLDYETLPAIFVTKLREEKEQAFTMMHELAHLIMHKGSKVDDADSISYLPAAKRGEEWEANMLASHILLPERELRGIDAYHLRLSWGPVETKRKLRRVCEACCVSPAAVLARLCLAGKLPRENYESYMQWSKNPPEAPSAKGMSQACKEKIHVLGSRYILTVLEGAAQKELTTYKAMVHLDTNGATFDELDRLDWIGMPGLPHHR